MSSWSKLVLMIGIVLFLVFGQTTTDVIEFDNNIYKTVKIGEQLWMSENLKVEYYRNGDAILKVTDNIEWSNLNTGALCEFNNDINNVATYGRLYNWYAINDSRKIAPEGWHIPTVAEWESLEEYLGGNCETAVGGIMKEPGTTHWDSLNIGATNESGFTALPGGLRIEIGDFFLLGKNAHFWSSSQYDKDIAWACWLNRNDQEVRLNYYKKQVGFSVRCIRD